MAKRVLFCIENFHQGGINKALENLISLMDKDKYEVSFFVVNREEGPYKDIFAPFLAYEEDLWLKAFCTHLNKHTGWPKLRLLSIKSARKLFAKFGYDFFNARLKMWGNRISNDHYDCVIAFAEGYVTEFVSHINAYKIAWIHIDYKRYLSYVGDRDEKHIYDKFNYVIIPSKFSKDSFSSIFPSFADKICVSPNIVDSQRIKAQSTVTEIDDRFLTDRFTLISVGRICYEKRFFEIPSIARKMKEKGVDFRWYVLGGGSDIERALLVEAIRKNGMEQHVVLLGMKDNPYPYIAKSDLLVSTSLSETFSYVVFEAKTLGVPVVCADFGTAPEILSEEEGVITPLPKMADEIYSLITRPDTYAALKSNLKDFCYDNSTILNKLYQLFDK